MGTCIELIISCPSILPSSMITTTDPLGQNIARVTYPESSLHLHIAVFIEVFHQARNDSDHRVVTVTQDNNQPLVLHRN